MRQRKLGKNGPVVSALDVVDGSPFRTTVRSAGSLEGGHHDISKASPTFALAIRFKEKWLWQFKKRAGLFA